MIYVAFAQEQNARGERDREGEGDSKDKHRSSHACCHQQAALSRRLALGDAAVGARGGGSGASDGAGAQQAAEALQAGFDGGVPAPDGCARARSHGGPPAGARARAQPRRLHHACVAGEKSLVLKSRFRKVEI